jgi:predicted LPLAT superfamily acyltransferase
MADALPPVPAVPARRGWLDIAEVGSAFGIRTIVVLCTLFGRGVGRLVVAAVALYFVILRPRARRNARLYRQRLGVRAGFRDVYRQVRRFAEVSMDRMFFLRGQFRHYQMTSHGHEILVDLKNSGRGAILLGAHLGSFEAMRMRSAATQIPINIVGYFRNAARMNAVLQSLGPNLTTRLIEVEPGAPGFILQVQERIQQGELVAILGDRAGHGARTQVDFLGGRIELPTGPYMLAAVLKCPVYLTFCLYQAPNRYDLYCEPFAEEIVLPRKEREQALHAQAQRYAQRLEHYCRLAPDNWFNFADTFLD